MAVLLEVFKSEIDVASPEALSLVNDIAKTFEDQVEVKVYDLLKDPKEALRYDIKKVPTIIIDGTIRFTGLPTKQELIQAIEAKIERVKTGVSRLDDLIEGGIPKGASILVVGDLGVGKSIFCQQIIYARLKQGDPCIYIALDEPPLQIRKNMERFGWNVSSFEAENQFRFIDAFSWRTGAPPKSTVEYFIENPRDHLQWAKAFEHVWGEVGGGKATKGVYVIDSINEMLAQMETKPAVDFIKTRKARFSASNILGLHVFHKGVYDDIMPHLAFFEDGIIELLLVEERKKLNRYLRICKMLRTDHTTGIVQFVINKKQGIILRHATPLKK
ncbi:MAG: thioredoxin family protein [Euryarchaeota archaeon]|nr:thioredoxin family protein [Euryarchaeota archaeon]